MSKKRKRLSIAKTVSNQRSEALEIVESLKQQVDTELRRYYYGLYLQTPHWLRLRKLRKKIDDNRCVECGGKKNLQVHHTSYTHLCISGELDDIITVCEKCHKKLHGIQQESIADGESNTNNQISN